VKRPHNINVLKRELRSFATANDLTLDRATRYIAYNAFFGLLSRAKSEGVLPMFLVKGGVALELRLGIRARATRDVDIGLVASPSDLLPLLRQAVGLGWDEFTFTIKSSDVTEHGTVRLEVGIQYRRKAWSTIKVDVTPADSTSATEFIDGFPIAEIGLPNAPAVPCLNAIDQIAQKIHAVTGPTSRNRSRDLVDLTLLAPLIADRWDELRIACEQLFAQRATHQWPPTLEVRPDWPSAIDVLLDGLTSSLRADDTILNFHVLMHQMLQPREKMKAEYRYLLIPSRELFGGTPPAAITELGATGYRQIQSAVISHNSQSISMFLVFERLTNDGTLPLQAAATLPRLHLRLTSEGVVGNNASGRILVGRISNLGGSVANRVRVIVSGAADTPRLGMIAPGDNPVPVAIPYPNTNEIATSGMLAVSVQYADDHNRKLQQTGSLRVRPLGNYECDGIEAPIEINQFTVAYTMGEN